VQTSLCSADIHASISSRALGESSMEFRPNRQQSPHQHPEPACFTTATLYQRPPAGPRNSGAASCHDGDAQRLATSPNSRPPPLLPRTASPHAESIRAFEPHQRRLAIPSMAGRSLAVRSMPSTMSFRSAGRHLALRKRSQPVGEPLPWSASLSSCRRPSPSGSWGRREIGHPPTICSRSATPTPRSRPLKQANAV